MRYLGAAKVGRKVSGGHQIQISTNFATSTIDERSYINELHSDRGQLCNLMADEHNHHEQLSPSSVVLQAGIPADPEQK